MLKIEIDDPNRLDKSVLSALSQFFAGLSDGKKDEKVEGALINNLPIYGSGSFLQPQSVTLDDLAAKVADLIDRDKSRWPQLSPEDEKKVENDDYLKFGGAVLQSPKSFYSSVKIADVIDEDDPNEELDASGETWDKTKHSRTRSKDEQGNWKKQRGHTKTEATPPPPPVVLESSDPVTEKRTFPVLMQIITKAVTAKKTDQHAINRILNAHGVANLPSLPANDDKVKEVWDEIMQACGHE